MSAFDNSLKKQLRFSFLQACHEATKRIQMPILDIDHTKGHLNPRGLGYAHKFSAKASLGQSSVAFDTVDELDAADESRQAPYGGAEYGVVQTPEAHAVAQKFAKLHYGSGAIICSSGLAAISTTIDAFAPKAILVPENVYFPAYRYMTEGAKAHIYTYPPNISARGMETLLKTALLDYDADQIMLYMEAPGSGTFEIPDINGLVKEAKLLNIRTVMDNTWASHVRFKPMLHGIDIAIQATTKYEGGYGDTPSGVVIANQKSDFDILKRRLRISGNGAVSPQTCMRLFYRVDSAEKRLDQHAATAEKLMAWFEEQPFVASIISPAHKSSPYHDRFKKYFGKGNGLFTIEFREDIPAEKVKAFIDALLLFRNAESWGGHVSLARSVHPSHRKKETLPAGTLFRFHAGLEDARDLIRDLEQASRAFVEQQFSPQSQATLTNK